MLTRLFWLLLVATGLLLGMAGLAQLRAQALTHEAAATRAASEEAATAFAGTFDGSHQERELALLDQRRAQLVRASAWKRGTLVCLVLAVLTAFAAWVSREVRVVRETIDLEVPGHPET